MMLAALVSLLAAAACIPFVSVSASSVNFQAWQMQKNGTLTFPELELAEVVRRPHAGIAFSGGGSRSFLATIGYLAGFHDIGLLSSTRYISGVSGGAWATGAFTFAKVASDNDTVLLGPVVDPKDITPDGLKHIDPECLRSAPVNKDMYWFLLKNFFDKNVEGRDVWYNAVNEVFFKPYGIPNNKFMAPIQAVIDLIVKRNPDLSPTEFVLPRPNRPYWISGITYLGPFALSPFPLSNRSFTTFEATPYYVGQPRTRQVKYVSRNGTQEKRTVGGYIESFAFGNEAPNAGLTNTTGVLTSSTIPDRQLNPVRAASMSSFAAGAFLSDLPGFASRGIDPIFKTWSPSEPHPNSADGLYGDGGNSQNLALTSMLQRRVPNIILFFNNNQPLNSSFDPDARPVTSSDMTTDLPTFFGINPGSLTPLWDLSRNQVFPSEDFARVAKGLIAAQLGGNGTFYRTELETVENKWYSVDKGIKANITFVYLSRTLGWEQQLPSDLRKQIQPELDPSNPSNLIDKGTFKNFPNINTYLQVNPSVSLANMISHMCGWIVKHNQDFFRLALGI